MPPRWLGLLLVSALVACGRGAPAPEPCPAALAARDWKAMAARCVGPRWESHAALGAAWRALGESDDARALELATALLDGELGADAAYLAGYLRARRDAAAGRALLLRALEEFQRRDRHGDASRAAGVLSRVPRPEARFDDELHMAQLAVREADASGDTRLRAVATLALAEAYDGIGMAREAREAFLDAADLAAAWPDELAFAYFKHAVFVLDLGGREDLRTALRYLDAAAAEQARAAAAGLGGQVASLPLAIALNRATALIELGELDEAAAELARLPADRRDRPKAILVHGYLAARRGDRAAAAAAFERAGELEDDYRWQVALELARLDRGAGRLGDAEARYRAAIAIIEGLREDAGAVELRPWVLERRMRPYAELLALLAEQDRGIDALAVAESLHARAWLDAALRGDGANAAAPAPTAEEALRDARVRSRVASTPPLSGRELLALAGAREALVFVPAGDRLWRVHVAGGRVRVVELGGDAIAAMGGFRAVPDDPVVAARAAALLLPAELGDGEAPLWIVGRPAADIPFAALPWRGRPLVMTRPIAHLPGLAAMRCTPAAPPPMPPAGASAPGAVAAHVVLGDSRGDLPRAAAEVAAVARRHGVTGLTGAQVTRAALEGARHAALLHLAVHGRISGRGAALVLADGDLTAADVLDAALAPRVVMLTGCNTAAAVDAESWGGFPSAFLASGAGFVVSTLRSVEDAAAATVTAAYYAQPDALDPVRRLAAAQRQVAGSLPAHQWASFTAWGVVDCP